jgi:CubicO group peptidase (beta-lactamase class C family)
MGDFTFVASSPSVQGISEEDLDNLVNFSDSISDASGMLVMRNDKVVHEHYVSGGPETRWDTQSVTKSFGAALLLIALDRGTLSLDDCVCGRDDMTVHHLASMTSGFPKPWDANCKTSLLFKPGTDFCYSDGGSNILRDVVRDAFGVTELKNFFREEVMEPIGASNWEWDERFNAGLYTSVRELAKYGRLWLRKGDWEGVRVFSEYHASLATTASNPRITKGYGYLWWVNSHEPSEPYDRYGFKLNPIFGSHAPRDAFIGIGASKTFILVIPSLALVVTRSGSGFHSIQAGDSRLSDESRRFVDLVLAMVKD